MEFQTLKKNHKKEILIGGMILVCVISAITITTTRAKYKLTEDIKLASGTINYKPYDFKIMAMYQENDSGNYSEITTMPESGYVVNEEKSYCTTDNITQVKGKIKTIDGHHVIENLKKTDKCYIWFDKYVPPITVDDIIASNNPKTTTPDFSNIADTDEGVYKVEDGMYEGYSYYWRGAVTNNHVIFANKCWRIIRINGDGSVRLIYNGSVKSGNTCAGNGSNADSIAVTNQYYYSNSGRSEYVGYTYTQGSQRGTKSSSILKNQTDIWYNNNIGNNTTNASKVEEGKFCNDRNLASGNWSSQSTTMAHFYAAYGRLVTNKTPTLSCPTEDVYLLKAGAITADEIVFAGGVYRTTNNSYYLYNGQYYWTMSPDCWTNSAIVFNVDTGGSLNSYFVYGDYGVRPVINLKPETKFNGNGNGTQTNPYIVQ